MYIDAFVKVFIFVPRLLISFSNWLLNDSTEVVQDKVILVKLILHI